MAGWGMLHISLMLFATVHSKEMNMEQNAVDDTYSTCRDQMLQKVLGKGGILQKELMAESVFSKTWNATDCQKQIPNGRSEHTQALESIGVSVKLLKEFNMAVETKGGSVSIYTDQFHFKALHFLLMDAMHLLKPEKCLTVYYGIFEDLTAVKGSKVRFGRFLAANGDRSFAEEGCVDDGTMFSITSCSVINLDRHVCTVPENVLLISPTEVFTVAEVKSNTECKREIVLMSAGSQNNHDCYLFPRLVPTIAPKRPTTAAKTDSTPTEGHPAASTQWVSSSEVVLLSTVLHICLIFLAL